MSATSSQRLRNDERNVNLEYNSERDLGLGRPDRLDGGEDFMLRSLHTTLICGTTLLLLLGILALQKSASAQEPLPEVPATISKHVTAHFEGPYLVNGNRIIDRRPTCVIWPSQFEDRVLPGGVLSELRAYPKITGLRLHRGPAMSEAGSQYYEIDVTPAAIADIAALTHLESLDIEAIDLSHLVSARAGGRRDRQIFGSNLKLTTQRL